ncbi:formin-like protein 18 [Lycium barbarum]|uniref:formin-like protein 18 n=1 Tax=Lycium barbarum TaxID=112863 RepID=UPI00293E64EF|nr:formin-like protein 18 [Lycium barbarum]
MARTCIAAARGRGGGRGAGRGAAPVGSGVPVVDPVPPVVPNKAAGVAAAPARPTAVLVPPGAAAAQGVPDALSQVLNLLRGLAQGGAIPVGPAGRGAGVAAPDPDRAQAPGVQQAAVVAPRLDEVRGF